MANLSTMRKFEMFEKLTGNGLEKQDKPQTLVNYMELSAQMSMPVLKVSDLIDETCSEKSEEQVAMEIPISEKSIEQININIVPMQSDNISTEDFVDIPKLDINAQAYARKIVDNIEDEVHRLIWKRKGVIRSKIKEINIRNAYSFVGYIRTVSDSGTVLGDIKRYITYSEVKHLMFCLMQQAKQAGLVNIAQYLRLKREYNNVTKLCSKKLNKKLDSKTALVMNTALENMYEEMTKIF